MLRPAAGPTPGAAARPPAGARLPRRLTRAKLNLCEIVTKHFMLPDGSSVVIETRQANTYLTRNYSATTEALDTTSPFQYPLGDTCNDFIGPRSSQNPSEPPPNPKTLHRPPNFDRRPTVVAWHFILMDGSRATPVCLQSAAASSPILYLSLAPVTTADCTTTRTHQNIRV
jgi:hypothetical protein